MNTSSNAPAPLAGETGQPVPRFDDRPVPFTLRVAVHWMTRDEAMQSSGDRPLLFSRRAGMTGELAITDGGKDMSMSDLELG